MFQPDDRSFEAWLPNVTQPIRITCLHDAQVFTRRWVIRDKDPALKVLVRRLEKAHGADLAADAMRALQEALAARRLLAPSAVPVLRSPG